MPIAADIAHATRIIARGATVSPAMFGAAVENGVIQSDPGTRIEIVLWRCLAGSLTWEEYLSALADEPVTAMVASRTIWDLAREKYPDSPLQIEFHVNYNRIAILTERP